MEGTRPPSRIGMGRLNSTSGTAQAASTAAAVTAAQTTPPAGPSGIPLTPSSYQTPNPATEQQQQELPAQKGHPAATPVFNISPATAAEQAGPIPSITTSSSSKWKSSSASSSSGPVFSVVSRGNRITAGNGHTPPPPPAKASSTIARTANRLQGRSTSSTSPSGSSIGLRGQRATPSTLSSGPSGPAARAFGSKIGAGRFGDGSNSTASSTRSCTTPLISNTSCKSVARTLSFDEAADSPKSATPGINSSKNVGAATKPRAGLAGKPPAGAAHTLATASSMDDVEQSLDQLDQLTNSNNSSSDSTTWLSGANNSADGGGTASCSNSPFAGLEQPPAADLLGMPGQHAVADLAAVEALLPSVRAAVSARAAAEARLQQLVRSAGSLTAVAGLHGDAALAAVLGSSAGSGPQGSSSLQDTSKEDQGYVETARGSSSSGGNSNSFGGVLLGQAARMLQAGASVQQVRQAVMPALLLQLASLAADCSSTIGMSHGSRLLGAEAAGDGAADDASAAQVAEAAGLLAAGLQAGLAAAKAAVEGTAGFPASSSASSSAGLARGGAKSRRSSAVGNLVLLLWSSLLLVVGFVAAAVLSVLEGEAMLGGGFGSAAAAAGGGGGGFCGVGPGGAYGVAAELCGGLGVDVGWQQQAGADMQDWGAAAVQHGRRFGA